MSGISPRSVVPPTPANIALAKAVLANDAAAIRAMVFEQRDPFASDLPSVVEGQTRRPGVRINSDSEPKRILAHDSPADPNAFLSTSYASLLGHAVRQGHWDAAQALMEAGAHPFSGATTLHSQGKQSVEMRGFTGSALWSWPGEGIPNPLYPPDADLKAVGAWFESVMENPKFLETALESSTVSFRADLFRRLWGLGKPVFQDAARQVEASIAPEDRAAWLGKVVQQGTPGHVKAIAPSLATLSHGEFYALHADACRALQSASLWSLWEAIQCRPKTEWVDWLAPIPGQSPQSRQAIADHGERQLKAPFPVDYSFYGGLLTHQASLHRKTEPQWAGVLEQALAAEGVGEALRARWPVLLGATLFAQASKKSLLRVAALVPADASWETLTCTSPLGKELSPLVAAMPPDHLHASIESLRWLEKKGVQVTEEVMLAVAHQITYSVKVKSVGRVFLEWGKKVPLTDGMFEKIRLEKDREGLKNAWRQMELDQRLPEVSVRTPPKPRF